MSKIKIKQIANAPFGGPLGITTEVRRVQATYGLKTPETVKEAEAARDKTLKVVPRDRAKELADAIDHAIMEGKEPASLEEVRELALNQALYEPSRSFNIDRATWGRVEKANIAALPEWVPQIEEAFNKRVPTLMEYISHHSLTEVWNPDRFNVKEARAESAHAFLKAKETTTELADLASVWATLATREGIHLKDAYGAIVTPITPREWFNMRREQLPAAGGLVPALAILQGDIWQIAKFGYKLELKDFETTRNWFNELSKLAEQPKPNNQRIMFL